MRTGELSAAITRIMSKSLGSAWKWYKGYKEIASHDPCYPANCEHSWKKTQIERQKKENSSLQPVRTNFRRTMSEERLDTLMSEVPIIYFYGCNL